MHLRLCALTAVGALALGASASATAAPAAKPTLPPPANLALAHDIFAQLIAINTVHDKGTVEIARAIVERLKAGGFTDADITVVAPPEHPTYPDVIVRLRGKGRGKPVLWMGHMDVVEAKAEDWTLPPFKLTEKDGYYYGRGTSDMKGDDTAIIASLIRLKQEGFVPDRDVIAAFTTDEESGDANGADWLMKDKRDLIDAAVVINSDGGGPGIKDGRMRSYGVQTSEKIYVTFQLETTNKGGHSSRPRPDNAIYQLAEGLVRLSRLQQPLHLTDTTRGYFAKMATFETGQARDDMLALSKPDPDPAAVARIGSTPEGNAQLHTTCVATEIAGGHAENALPQRARASFQCRMMPGETQDELQQRIVTGLADPGVAVTVINPAKASPESPPTPDIMGRIGRAVESMWPGTPLIPVLELGATDGLYTRGGGMPTYGASGMGYDIDDIRAHGRDERLPVKAFDEGVEFTYRLIKEMSRAQ
jgi:acetylornithine deacetylase/succinyl-diaminopimelate desuccinylase-like protein